MLIEAPALDLLHDFVELSLWNRFVDESFAATEFAEIPFAVLEFGGDREPPQRQKSAEIGIERIFSAIERSEVAGEHVGRHVVRHPPDRVERILQDRAQTKLLGHIDLRRQQARRFHFAVEQS